MESYTYRGKNYELTCVGTGSWCSAFKDRKSNKVFLFVAGDGSKDIVSEFPKYRHIPKVKLIETINTDSGWRSEEKVYLSEYYRRLSSRHTKAWRHYKILERLNNQAWRKASSERNHQAREASLEFGRLVKAAYGLPNTLKKAIRIFVEACAENCYYIEIAERNLGIDKDGNLVLMDLPYQ